MNPLLLFPLSLIMPIIVALVAFIPAYGSIFAAVYTIYDKPDTPNPLSPYMFDVFYIFSAYGRVFDHWSNHMASSDLVNFTLPFIGLPILGISLSLFLTYKLIGYMVNFFRMATNNN
jgi:hypothetical protein